MVTQAPDIYKTYYYRVAAMANGQIFELSNVVSAQVDPTTYRAVLIGNTNYPYFDVDWAIPDSIQIQNALNIFKDGTEIYTINRYSNLSMVQILSTIPSDFVGADANDVSLFYYSGRGTTLHPGETTTNVSLLGVDLQNVYVDDLKGQLDAIPGKKIVIIEANFGGGFIARNGDARTEETEEYDAQAFVNAFTAAFADGSRTLNQPGYVVMASARSDQNANGVYVNGRPAGLFTYYLLEGLGWDHTGSCAYPTMYADANYDNDGIVTFSEAFTYAYVNTVNNSGTPQYAQMYPYGLQEFFYAR